MRALLTILCLFSGSPAERVGDDVESAQLAKRAEYRAIIAEIAPNSEARSVFAAEGLPEPLREALEVWIAAGA